MDFEIKLTSGFLKKSHFRRMFRNWWKIVIAFCLVFFAILLDLSSGGLGSISTIGLTLICMCVLICFIAWYKQRKRINDFIDRQGNTPVRYKLTEETVQVESLLGVSKLSWDAFTKLRISDLDTHLEFSHAGALILPTNQLNKEILEFLQDRFAAHGKKILTKNNKA